MSEIQDELEAEPVKKVVKPRTKKTVTKKPPTQVVEAEPVKNPIAVKPPTQGVGVVGFKADVYAVDEVKINWPLLMTLPKFQMYCVELSKRHHGEVEMWMTGFLKDQLMQGEKVFFQAYCDWHDAKGYWKQETPYGELIEG